MGQVLRSETFGPENAKNINALASQRALAYAAQHPNGAGIADPGSIYGGGMGGKNPYGTTVDALGHTSYVLPYPNAPHDGGPQDLANTQAMVNSDQKYNTQQYITANQPSFIDKLIPALAIGMATAGVGSGVGAGVGSALGGGTAGTIGGGAAGGATAAGLAAAVRGQNPLKSALIGGLTGGIGSGLTATGLGQQATGALQNMGLSVPVSTGILRGATGAGLGALGSALSGNNPANGALIGGLSGAASGALGQATGNPGIGQLGGTIAGTLAGQYLTSPSRPSPPVTRSVATPVTRSPGMSNTQQGMPSPVTSNAPSPVQSTGISTPAVGATPPAPSAGPYSGYGYTPRQQVQTPVQDYSNYGSGPEAQFFKPQGT